MKSGDWEKIEYDVVCPQCGVKAFEAGTAFKAPKQRDKKAWEKLRPLFESGYKFNSDMGNPFKGPVIYKASQLPVIRKFEFLKPARKRRRAR